MANVAPEVDADEIISVGALHALIYCERLYFLEEVEQIRVADAAVFAGRRLHVELAAEGDGTFESVSLESTKLGIRGRVDVLRRRDGQLVPYEHKRGRCAGIKGAPEAWETDRIQVGAYSLLVEEAFGQVVVEARVRYHASSRTVRVAVDEQLRAAVRNAIVRARELRHTIERPAVTENEKLCARCSLAVVCLPEESRLGVRGDFKPIRLLPQHADRQTIHVTDQGARVSRRASELIVVPVEGTSTRFPIADVGSVVLHGFAQISTQAIRLCADNDVDVHWMTMGGGLVGSLAPSAITAQRHLRQFSALADSRFCLRLAKRLVTAKVSSQLRFLLRASREHRTEAMESRIREVRARLRGIERAPDATELLGIEGAAAREYFGALPSIIRAGVDESFRFEGRSRRPPRDPFNALLGFGYGMLYRSVLAAIVAVGLHPGVSFYHRPRSGAQTLALDLMELFRVPIVDMALVAAVNRGTFDVKRDFRTTPAGVLLTDSGKARMIETFERRLSDDWRHTAVGYSLSYARMIELEVRLLEKEWMGEGGLFATFRIR